MAVSLDKVDFLILQKLMEDGRASFSAIARDTNLTDVAIKKRVERLKRRGIISGIHVNLNLKVLGYENPIFIQIRTELSKSKDVIKKLSSFDYIMELNQVLGEHNLLAKVVVPDFESAEQFLGKLGQTDGVLDVKTMVVLSEIKKGSTLPAQPLQKKIV